MILLALAGVSDDVPLATELCLLVVAALVVFFALRPRLWQRLWFTRIDPRGPALMRIAFGLVVTVTFIGLLAPHPPLDYSLARFLFTDEGLWLTDLARKNYGGELRTLWDPQAGFQHWTDIFDVLWGPFTVLHLRSDPTFVFTLYTAMLVCLISMTMGHRTRISTICAFVLCEMLYRYSPVFYTGGDTVIRVFLFLGIFLRWGDAYSIDAWRRRLLGQQSSEDRGIPAWPLRLMMLQLACIYCATGLLKSGPTWSEGTALYYALNLDHFYRWPMTHTVTLLQYSGVLPLMTWLVHWWEVFFPVVLVGLAINAFESDRAQGLWPEAPAWRRWAGYLAFGVAWLAFSIVTGMLAHHYLPADSWLPEARRFAVVTAAMVALPLVCVAGYRQLRRSAPKAHAFIRHWLLGKRTWLVFGFAMHLGIALSMNVGTFAQVMMALYFGWLSGEEIDRGWQWLGRTWQRLRRKK